MTSGKSVNWLIFAILEFGTALAIFTGVEDVKSNSEENQMPTTKKPIAKATKPTAKSLKTAAPTSSKAVTAMRVAD